MRANYVKHFSTLETDQKTKVRDDQVENSEGGYVFEVDKWKMLDRFLILGSEGGTFYLSEKNLTLENAKSILECLNEDGVTTVNRIVEISDSGRAFKNSPAIYALAMAAGHPDKDTRKAALEALPKVCRMGTYLFEFVEYIQKFRGWGRLLCDSISNWYLDKDVDTLVYQLLKYRQREGWTHRDLLRKSHPKTDSVEYNEVFKWVVSGYEDSAAPNSLQGKAQAQVAAYTELNARAKAGDKDLKTVADIIVSSKLPREAVPTEYLGNPIVYEALFKDMPLKAVIRNLANFTKCGLLVEENFYFVNDVVERITNEEHLRKARVHPLSIFIAARKYGNTAGSVGRVTAALEDSFYKAFEYVQPSYANYYFALDVSGSMGWTDCAGVSDFTCAEGAALLAMTLVRTESRYVLKGFSHQLTDLPVHSNQSFKEVLKAVNDRNFGATDCSLPMLDACKKEMEIDAFVVFTDSETYYGDMHPYQALMKYRKMSGRNAKLIVVALESNRFSIADPNDAGMLDVVGFDASLPKLITEFTTNN